MAEPTLHQILTGAAEILKNDKSRSLMLCFHPIRHSWFTIDTDSPTEIVNFYNDAGAVTVGLLGLAAVTAVLNLKRFAHFELSLSQHATYNTPHTDTVNLRHFAHPSDEPAAPESEN